MALRIASVAPYAEATQLPNVIYGFLVFLTREVLGVLGVEVFGELARTGKGKTVEVIFLVEEKHWNTFFTWVNFYPSAEYTKGQPLRSAIPSERYKAMIKTLGIDIGIAFENLEKNTGVSLGDVYLLPVDWRERIPEIERLLGQENDGFIQSLANVAMNLSEDGPLDKD